MKITVTGGCGYVGSTLVPKLATLADEVRVLDINPPALRPEAFPNNVKHHQLDIADQANLKPLLQGSDLIIHLAAVVGYPACNKAPDIAVRCNVGGTTAVLRNKEKHAPVLFASTCSNYGEQNGLVTEDTPLNPRRFMEKQRFALKNSFSKTLGTSCSGLPAALAAPRSPGTIFSFTISCRRRFLVSRFPSMKAILCASSYTSRT